MFATEDQRKVFRLPFMALFFGKKSIEKAYVGFMDTFNELFDPRDGRRILQQEALRLMLFNKINVLLPTLYWSLKYKPSKELHDEFKEYFGKDPKGAEDLYLIVNEIRKLTNRFKLLYLNKEKDDKEEESGPFQLEALITSIETIIERPLDRNLKVYQLRPYNQLAIKILNTRESQRERLNSMKRK
jgi:hypothetical protein